MDSRDGRRRWLFVYGVAFITIYIFIKKNVEFEKEPLMLSILHLL